MSSTLAPLAVDLTEQSLVITPAGTRVTGRSVNLAGEGDDIPGCTTAGTEGIAVCKSFQPLVMFVGGAWDVRMNLLIEDFGRYDRANESRQDIGYASWNRDAALFSIALHWRAQRQKIVLVGHSMGGAKAHAVSKRLSDAGHEVELLVTLDPVFRDGA
jgi:pimeloyl-ACP methyl ester carboxylesterase